MTLRCLVASVFLVAVSMAGLGCSNQFKAVRTQNETFTHVAAAPVSIESRNGSIEIIADQTVSDVQIQARVSCSGDTQEEADERLAQATLSIARSANNTLVIKPIFPNGGKGNDGASFTVRLPDANGITIDTSNGRVTVSSLAGDLNVDTSNGSINVTDHNGSADLHSSNGNMKVIRLKNRLLARTSNGSVTAEEISGAVDIDTSNGSISVSLAADQTGPLRLDSSNGSLRAQVGPAFAGTVRMDTSNGSVKVVDPTGRAKSCELHSTSGFIRISDGGEASMLDTSNGRIEFVISG